MTQPNQDRSSEISDQAQDAIANALRSELQATAHLVQVAMGYFATAADKVQQHLATVPADQRSEAMVKLDRAQTQVTGIAQSAFAALGFTFGFTTDTPQFVPTEEPMFKGLSARRAASDDGG